MSKTPLRCATSNHVEFVTLRNLRSRNLRLSLPITTEGGPSFLLMEAEYQAALGLVMGYTHTEIPHLQTDTLHRAHHRHTV